MPFPLKNKLAFKLVIQMVAVIVIIAMGFFLITTMQAKQMQKRLFDKSRLFSVILGANLDKIIGDNLKACRELQEATALMMKASDAIEALKVISPEHIILSSNSGKEIWSQLDEPSRPMVEEVLRRKQPQSTIKTFLGKELVVHFMPIFAENDKENPVMGVIQVDVRFPSRQTQLISSLRTNKRAYFRKEAFDFAQKLTRDLQFFLSEAQRNFGYLESLIQNILTDKDFRDIKLYARDLGVFISGSSGQQTHFVVSEKSPLHAEVMEKETTLSVKVKRQNDVMEVASPLYLKQGEQKIVGGAVSILFSLQQTKALIAEMRGNLLVMSLAIMGAFCLLIGLFFKRNIFNPVNDLIEVTNTIKRGDFNTRCKIHSEDEIGKLAQAFNRMLDELQRSKWEIDDWNNRLQERVDKVSSELSEKQSQLVKSEKIASLGVLSSGVAHEINNPLGIILGHTQMLLKEFKSHGTLPDPKEAEELLTSIEQYTKRCSHIVKSLLQFSRKRELQFSPVELASAIENALLFTSGRLSQKNIEVVKDFKEDIPSILADAIQVEQVFINLLLNAEQSMKEGGRIRISTQSEKSAQKTSQTVAVIFEDNGAGIPEGHRGNIFDPFFSTKEPGEGVGLGLSVSYGIIKAHNGDIEVESQEGKGTTITVKFIANSDEG